MPQRAVQVRVPELVAGRGEDRRANPLARCREFAGPFGAEQQARVAAFRAAFPDLRFTLEDLVAEGDRVVFRATMRGTHRAPFRGVAPTGRRIEGTVLDVVRVEGGRFAEHWGGPDLWDVLRQLGAAPGA